MTQRCFSDWLRKVDPSGALDCYLAVLEEHGDVDTVEDYQVSLGGGRFRLDESFFADFGIVDLQHRGLFIRHFAGPRDAPSQVEPHESESKTVTREADHDAICEQATRPPVKESCMDGFESWLGAIDPSGSLDGYLAALEENFDFEEIDKLYLVHDGARTALRDEFFDDIGVENETHKQLFKSFYVGNVSVQPRCVSLDRSHGAKVPDATLGCSFAQWLREVDSSGDLDGYLIALEEHCGSVDELTAEFISTLGVSEARHQRKFDAYFQRPGSAK